jgi:hypothetical protein
MVGTVAVHFVTGVLSVRAMVRQDHHVHLGAFSRRAAKHGRSQRTPQGEQKREKQQNENAERLHFGKVSRFVFPGRRRGVAARIIRPPLAPGGAVRQLQEPAPASL